MINKNTILIVCALPDETQNLLSDWNVLYTGVGKVNAAISLSRTLSTNKLWSPFNNTTKQLKQTPKLIINYGSAGSSLIEKNTLVNCTSFAQWDMNATELGLSPGKTPFDKIKSIIKFDDFFDERNNYICGTGDTFLTNSTIFKFDVVDMEAYSLAKICKWFNFKFTSYKFITDSINSNSKADWSTNHHKGITTFLQLMHDKNII